MASNNTFINLKTRAKKSLLAFTLLISFFALLGYVNNNLPNTRTTNDSGAMLVNHFITKSGISYKRAVLALYKSSHVSLLTKDDLNELILLFNELSINRYQQLKQLYLVIKPTIHFRLLHSSYPSDTDSFGAC